MWDMPVQDVPVQDMPVQDMPCQDEWLAQDLLVSVCLAQLLGALCHQELARQNRGFARCFNPLMGFTQQSGKVCINIPVLLVLFHAIRAAWTA